nr:PREDICTED: rap1 GTPase-activating protein 2 [Equus przewalskii]
MATQAWAPPGEDDKVDVSATTVISPVFTHQSFTNRYVQEGRFRIEERTLTAFQWLYSPQQHRILSRADLESPSRIDKTMLASLKVKKQELANSSDVTLPDRPLSPPLTAPPTMKVRGLELVSGEGQWVGKVSRPCYHCQFGSRPSCFHPSGRHGVP